MTFDYFIFLQFIENNLIMRRIKCFFWVKILCTVFIGHQIQKSELTLKICMRAYSSSCLQVILVYLYPFRRNSFFCSQKSKKH